MNRRWICTDVWMDILPSFDRPKLGLNLALLSYRFDALVDKHFYGKTTKLTIWRPFIICKDKVKLSVPVDGTFVEFPLPDRPLPSKIRFRFLDITYIDHSVIKFLNTNKQIWDRRGTELELFITCKNAQPIWDVFTREIWPIFATNIRHLRFAHRYYLNNLRRHISPTILTDLKQLNSISSLSPGDLFPDVIADDGSNATSAGHALSKWLHTPSTDGQTKRLRFSNYLDPQNLKWINYLKETFLRATTTSVSYKIRFGISVATTPTEPFELVNERTNEKLTLKKDGAIYWLLKRCSIIGETATDQKQRNKDENSDDDWEDENSDHLNRVFFSLHGNCIGPLSPPDQSDEKVFSFPGPSDQLKKKK